MSEFRLGWKPLTAALVGVACGASPIPFNVFGLIIKDVHAETGWSFTTINAGITTYGVIAALTAPVVGGLADRFGVRPVALTCLALFGLVFGSMILVPTTLTGWFAFWIAVGLVGIGSTPVTWSRTIATWFVRNRGLALGIMLLGTSLAGFLVPQIGRVVIENYGWKAAFPVLALLPLLIGVPIGLAWFREPRPEERPPGLTLASGELAGATLGEAIRNYRFWVLFVSIIVIAGAYGGAHINMVEMVRLQGFSTPAAAVVASVVALGILAGRVIVGLLFDRFWAPGIAFPVLIMPALACVFLMTDGAGYPLLLLSGFMLGFAAGAESDVIAFLAARYFGMRQYGRIYGLLYLPFGIGSAVSPILYGISRDRTGSYDAMLGVAAVMFVFGGALLLLMGRYPDAEAELRPEAV